MSKFTETDPNPWNFREHNDGVDRPFHIGGGLDAEGRAASNKMYSNEVARGGGGANVQPDREGGTKKQQSILEWIASLL